MHQLEREVAIQSPPAQLIFKPDSAEQMAQW